MNISSQVFYGVKAMARLAKERRFFSAKEIANQEFAPYDYLEKIMRKLARSGLIEARRGRGGGYILKHLPDKITIKSIFTALDDSPSFPSPCARGCCHKEDTCVSKDVWEKMSHAIDSTLESITLKK